VLKTKNIRKKIATTEQSQGTEDNMSMPYMAYDGSYRFRRFGSLDDLKMLVITDDLLI